MEKKAEVGSNSKGEKEEKTKQKKKRIKKIKNSLAREDPKEVYIDRRHLNGRIKEKKRMQCHD